MSKNTAFLVIAFCIGILTPLLGFPIVVDGTVSFKSMVIMVVLDLMFYLTLFAKQD